MLLSDGVLFIHSPKTGGTAIRRYLKSLLPRPIVTLSPKVSRVEHDESGMVTIPGPLHPTLEQALPVLHLLNPGTSLADLRLVIATVRNPYDLAVSAHLYARQGELQQQWSGEGAAAAGDGPELSRVWRPQAEHFLLGEGGELPANLRLLRFEHLEDDLFDALQSVGITPNGPLPRINHSTVFTSQWPITDDLEQLVYRRDRWLFERGYYRRREGIEHGTFRRHAEPDAPAVIAAAPTTRVVGPTEQVTTRGVDPDGWAKFDASLSAVATAKIGAFRVVGTSLRGEADRFPLVVTCNGERHWFMLDAGEAFDIGAPCRVGVGQKLTLSLNPGQSLSQQQRLDVDERNLSINLHNIEFLPDAEGCHALPSMVLGDLQAEPGSVRGCWGDGWAGHSFRVIVRAMADTGQLRLVGETPDLPGRASRLTVTANGRELATHRLDAARFEVPIRWTASAGEAVELQLGVDRTCVPSDHNPNGDRRALGFRVVALTAE